MNGKSGKRQRTNAKAGSSAQAGSSARRVVKAARRLFLSGGFRGVTMDDLARELGMSKKTFYAHFASKAELLRAVLLDKMADVEAELNLVCAGSAADFQGTLRRVLECMHRQMAEIQPAFVRDVQRDAPEIFEMVRVHRREMIRRHLGKILDDGRRLGMIRKDIPKELIMELVVGAKDAVMTPEKVMELGIAPRKIFVWIQKIIFGGILTDRGRQCL